jgi:cellulose synthase/poly-beta-1,6-N-acetylglucosamine synthase-like glycosyltransferase
MTLIIGLILILYTFLTLLLMWGWWRLPVFVPEPNAEVKTKISVIVPIRNEADNILNLLQDFENQSYSKDLLEIIIANDGSTDDSHRLVRDWIDWKKEIINAQIFNVTQGSASPKKRAITEALSLATGKLIVTTDGDCRVEPNWLRNIAICYENTQAKLISGPVRIIPTGKGILQRLFAVFQSIEFGSLIGSGAAAVYFGKPNMCNGANLAYEKAVFEEVGGYDGNETLASGDDEFLMHKIARKYTDGIVFLKSPQSIVNTLPQATLKDFYNQRKRWASKWRFYSNWQTIALAVFIFGVNLASILALLGWILDTNPLIINQIFIAKLIVEFTFLGLISHFFKNTKYIFLILLLQLIYPFYVVLFGLSAQQQGYHWKGRELK